MKMDKMYHLQKITPLVSAQGRLVAPQGERIIGWARCGTGITAGTLPNQG